MRSYGQLCGLAKALDVVGDRWSLLIIRELLIRGGCRYVDLKNGLPGIATNMLADRLRDLEQSGIVRREAAPPPVATTLFHLTKRGAAVEPIIRELGRWAAPLLAEPADGYVFHSHWLTLPLRFYFRDAAPERPPASVELRMGGEPIMLELAEGRVRTRPGPAEKPDLVLTGPVQAIMALFRGKLSLAEAQQRGLNCQGDVEIVSRIQPLTADEGRAVLA